MNYILTNGTIITMDNKNSIYRNGSIIIEDDKIIDIGKSADIKNKYRGYEKIDCSGCIILPPFINCHTHASMTLLRGYADDLPLHEWLTKWIFPIEQTFTEDDIFLGTQLACLESALSGTSCLNTMYYFMEREAEAISKIGLRGVVGHVCFSGTKKKDYTETSNLVKKWHNSKNGLIRVSIDPHSIYTVDPEYMKELYQLKNELNEKYGTPTSPIQWHIHTAETKEELYQMKLNFGKSENKNMREIANKEYNGVFDYLNQLGVLGPDIVAAHCVHLTERDIYLIKENNVKVVHNPISNMKLASGISPLPQMLEKKITIGLGTDGACSNNSLNMFETIKFTALLHKVAQMNPTVIPAKEAVAMATKNAAKVLGWDNEIGSLEKGKKADVLVLNLSYPHSVPLYDEYSHLAYSLNQTNVNQLIVNGNFIVENKKVKTIDVHKVIENIIEWKEKRKK